MTEHILPIHEGKTQINYLHQGEGTKTLLFLHGWCINSSYWEAQIAHFSRSYQVYALDLAGFGKSTSTDHDWSIASYGQDVNAFIAALDLREVILIGHSMSGSVMMEAASRNPTRIAGLIGVDNYKDIDLEYTPEQMEGFQEAMNAFKENFKESAPYFADLRLFHPSTREAIKNRIKEEFAQSDPTIGYESIISFAQYSQLLPAKLEASPFKLYLLNSEAIPTYEKGLEDHCKNGYEIHSVGHTGHYPMVENPDRFNEVLDGVIKGRLWTQKKPLSPQ